jgi:tRNA modification GTPase
LLDRALVLWFPGPRSYTGEDMAELQVHGGPAVLRDVAAALGCCGARPAEAGEFTRRAFLHGRLDLTAAEGIADLIDAESAAQRRQALRQADGAMARRYRDWSERLTRLLAHQEAAIEFAEEGLPHDLDATVLVDTAALREELAAELADGRRGERLREGLSIAIVGAPNAGKSSLLNALAERDAAIVSPLAGTTRDVVEVPIRLAGMTATVADTAGLREAGDAIEAEGVRRAEARAAAADIVLVLIAADREPDAATGAILRRRPDGILVRSKADLGLAGSIGPPAGLAVSVLTGEGLPTLRQALTDALQARGGDAAAVLLTRPRHRAAVAEAVGRLNEALAERLPELRAEALRGARLALGRITGEVRVEAVLDLVFRDFCIGK